MPQDFQYYLHPSLALGLNLYFCGHEVCRCGHSFGPAKREHYLFHYIIEGEGTYRVGDKIYTVREGEGFLIYPGDLTLYQADDSHPWAYYWIGFDGKDVPTILPTLGLDFGNHVTHSTSPAHTKDAFEQLLALSKTSTSYDTLYQIGALYRILGTFTASKETTKNSDYVKQAILFIQHNYAYPIKISDIAAAAGLERSYLYRMMMKDIGKSPMQYLIHYRLHMAKQLLAEDELTITEVAYSCGFTSSSAFYKHFKAAFSMTPLDYRRQ